MKIKADCQLSQVLEVIIGECRNGCTTPETTYEYFEKFNADHHLADVDLKDVGKIVSILNFPAIRENAETLSDMFEHVSDHVADR
jgi:hypothetical protein